MSDMLENKIVFLVFALTMLGRNIHIVVSGVSFILAGASSVEKYIWEKLFWLEETVGFLKPAEVSEGVFTQVRSLYRRSCSNQP